MQILEWTKIINDYVFYPFKPSPKKAIETNISLFA
jgi:hypothetical protein